MRVGIFDRLEQIALESYDRVVGIDFEDWAVDGCIIKAPCGGEAAGRSPVDRGKQGTKRSLLVDGKGIPLGTVVAPANRNDSPLLRPTLERLCRFGFHLPPSITVHLDAGYDFKKTRELLAELGCEGEVATEGKPAPLQVGKRWVVEHTNAWHTRCFRKLAICTERRTTVINAYIALANTIIIIRRLIREAWLTHRWDARPKRRP